MSQPKAGDDGNESTDIKQMKKIDQVSGLLKRSEEITTQYFELLDTHLSELISGRVDVMLELNDIAKDLCVSQKHLIKIVRETRGNHPCHFYVQKILEQAKGLLSNTDYTVSEIAHRLTYDPSNFTKFFKKYEGQTPSQYKAELKKRKVHHNNAE